MEQYLKDAMGMAQVDGHHFIEVLIRLLMAFLLASFVSFRPWRRFLKKPPVRLETAHAQILIAVAGAIVVAVVGDNLARAFGLVGLGGFVRFRSGIKDPRDAAVMFLMIGVGMACGIGVIPIAVVSTAFVGVVLTMFDAVSGERPQRLKVTFVTDNAPALLPMLRSAYPKARVLSAPNGGAPAAAGGAAPVLVQKIVLEMDVPDKMDAATLLAALEEQGAKGVREVTMSDD